MGRFAEARIQDMDEATLSRFERLLAVADAELQSWILASGDTGEGAAPGAERSLPAPEFADLIASVRSFHGLC